MQGSNFDLAPQDWVTLRGLLDTALGLPPAERDAWVGQLDARFAELRPRLRALLAHAKSPAVESLLDTLPKVETGQFAPPPKRDADGETAAPAQVGPYRLLSQIGDGGMASVWLAERTDLLQRRKVALKLPHGAWRRAGLAERMAREREILATLEHPNIARLYDAGLADDGQPYLALEYVEGRRIDEYCRTHALGVRQRLGLFLQVARAVAYAHAHLVVHRDIKPGNILVTEQGELRLLDFGIAKLLDQGVAEETELTRELGQAMTPDYAAPEQIQGRPLGTAADVYSLGVVLFELLTGRRPYQLKRGSRAALEDAILQAEPMRPSDAVAKGPAQRELRGDLDTIVLHALKKLPGDRYATVNAFADDIERWLTRRPVLAQADSRWYRLKKFVVRNRAGVSAGLGVASALVVATGAALWQAHEARSEQLRVQRVKSFITSIITDADPYATTDGAATTAVQLLHRARQRIATELADEPEVRAELLRVLGKSYAGLFDLANAEAVLTQAVEQTGALAAAGSGIADMAETLVELGEVKKLLGKSDEASALARRALSGLDMADRRHGDLYADAKLLEAGLALNKGDYSELSVAAQEAIRTSVALHGEANPRAAMAYGLISKTRGNTPEYQQVALDAARKSYDLYRALYPAKDRPHPSVIEAQQDYGVALLGMGELKQAEVHVAQALSDARLLYGESNIMSGHFGARLGQIHVLQGRLDIGVDELRAALGVLARVDPNRGVGNAGRHRNLALGLLALHRPGDAVAPLVEAIAILEERKDQRLLLVAKADLALARIELGQLQAASALLATIEQAGASLSPPERPLRAMARLASMRGQAREACAHLAQALQAAQRDPRRSFLADILIDLGRAEMALGKHDEAARHAEAALAEMDRSAVTVIPNHAAAWSVLGRSLMQRGLHADALPLLQRADERWQAFGISDRWAGETARALAQTYRALGREGEAARVAARVSKALASSPLPDATPGSGPIRSR